MKKNTTIHTLGDADAELIDPNNIPTPQRMNELSKFIFGKHFQMITIPDARLMLAVREHRILMPRENIFGLPKLFAFLVDTKQHPMFTHPGQGKKLVNLDRLLARLISYKEGYEDFFDEKDFGMFGGEVVNPDPYPSMDAEENEDYRRLEAATAKAMEWKWKRKSDEGWGLRG
ncbi:hypothetical protein HBH99_255780 [Parastagonospora nodorum]|nr:hypothetical protein HBH99_255780 [Parastagonospora nodorum]